MINNKPIEISTDSLCLRAIRSGDIDEIILLLTNEKIAKTFILPDFKSREEIVDLFNLLSSLSERVDRFVYGIDLDGKIIGFINDVEISGDKIELGFVIHPNYQCRGYATEVLSAAIVTLHSMGYTTVKTGAFEENIASRRVMEKCGMTMLNHTENLEYRGEIKKCILFEKSR